MHALLLHNPTAGAGEPPAEDLLRICERAGIRIFYQSSKEAGFARSFEAPHALVIAAGGDGTVAKAIGNLRDRRCPLVILPLGGANNIARSLGIPEDPEAIIAGVRTARAQPLSIGRADGPWGSWLFVDGVGIGALPRSMPFANEVREQYRDKIEAGRAALRRTVAEAAPDRLSLSLDGAPIEADLLLAEALNIRLAGPRLPLAARADPGDGLFDLVMVGPAGRDAFRTWLEDEDFARPAPVEVRRGARLTFTWLGEPLRVDDELPAYGGTPAEVSVEMEKEPVMVMVTS